MRFLLNGNDSCPFKMVVTKLRKYSRFAGFQRMT